MLNQPHYIKGNKIKCFDGNSYNLNNLPKQNKNFEIKNYKNLFSNLQVKKDYQKENNKNQNNNNKFNFPRLLSKNNLEKKKIKKNYNNYNNYDTIIYPLYDNLNRNKLRKNNFKYFRNNNINK